MYTKHKWKHKQKPTKFIKKKRIQLLSRKCVFLLFLLCSAKLLWSDDKRENLKTDLNFEFQSWVKAGANAEKRNARAKNERNNMRIYLIRNLANEKDGVRRSSNMWSEIWSCDEKKWTSNFWTSLRMESSKSSKTHSYTRRKPLHVEFNLSTLFKWHHIQVQEKRTATVDDCLFFILLIATKHENEQTRTRDDAMKIFRFQIHFCFLCSSRRSLNIYQWLHVS